MWFLSPASQEIRAVKIRGRCFLLSGEIYYESRFYEIVLELILTILLQKPYSNPKIAFEAISYRNLNGANYLKVATIYCIHRAK